MFLILWIVIWGVLAVVAFAIGLFILVFIVAFAAELLKRKPDLTIMVDGADYMYRWYILPRNRYFNIYLHHMIADDDEIMHDHPWWNISIILKGGYLEWMQSGSRALQVKWRPPGSVIYRQATDAHRLTLAHDYYDMKLRGCWSLFITGRIIRKWGFYCPTGWKPFDDYLREKALATDGRIKQGGC